MKTAEEKIKGQAYNLAECFFQSYSEEDCKANPECNSSNEYNKRLAEAIIKLVAAEREEAVMEFKIKMSKMIMTRINYKDDDTEREIGKYDAFSEIVEELLTPEK